MNYEEIMARLRPSGHLPMTPCTVAQMIICRSGTGEDRSTTMSKGIVCHSGTGGQWQTSLKSVTMAYLEVSHNGLVGSQSQWHSLKSVTMA